MNSSLYEALSEVLPVEYIFPDKKVKYSRPLTESEPATRIVGTVSFSQGAGSVSVSNIDFAPTENDFVETTKFASNHQKPYLRHSAKSRGLFPVGTLYIDARLELLTLRCRLAFFGSQGNGRNNIIWVAPTCTGKSQSEFQRHIYPPNMGILNKKPPQVAVFV